MSAPAGTGLGAPASSASDRGWRVAGAAMAVYLAAVLFGFRATAAAMVEIWERSGTFTHAFLVPPIVVWLVWRARGRLAVLTPRPAAGVVPVLALVAAAWWAGALLDANVVMQGALVALLVAGVPAVLGWRVTRVLLFPLGFSFFALPVGDFLTPILMQYTADFTVATLRLSGIPVYREALHFVIPSGRWSVVEACSGVRYLMASLMVGSLFAYLNFRTLRRRLMFCGLALLVPIVANWVRAYLIVLVGHLSDNRIATGVDHLIYGWLFFGIVITALFFIGARWSEPAAADDAAAPAPAAAAAPAPGRTLAIAACALVAAVWPLLLQPAAGPVRPAPEIAWPATPGAGWHVVAAGAGPEWRPAFVDATVERAQAYADVAGARVALHLAYYRGDGAKALSSVNQVARADDDAWIPLHRGRSADGTQPHWQSTELLAPRAGLLSSERPRLLVWHGYRLGGRWVAGELPARLLQGWLRAQREPDDVAAVFFATAVDPDDETAAPRRLQAFIAAAEAPLARNLDAAARAR